MKNNIRTVIGFLFSMILAATFTGPAVAAGLQLDKAAQKKIDAAAQRLVDEGRTVGIAIGVMSEGKIVYAKGFGSANLETGGKVTPDSVFNIGSITKTFTATSIMLLAEQGKLKIDDPISKYFPEFQRGDQVTIRQLLSHTSGIHGLMGGGPPQVPTPQQAATLRTTDDVVELITGLPEIYDFEPGTSWRYSNSGFWLLGAIVEQISGMPLGDFMKQNLFDRAGMTATDMDGPEIVPNRVRGYTLPRQGGGFMNMPRELIDIAGGAGGLHSTVGDLLQWQQAFASGKIVPAAAVREMTKPALLNNGQEAEPPSRRPDAPASKYGLGWSVGSENGHAFFGHTGGNPGFSAELKSYPDDGVAFVVLTNTGMGGGMRMQGPGRPGQGGRRMQGPDPQRMEGPPPGENISQRPTVPISQLLSEMITARRR